jgi:predicted nucleic acid-binding protein
MIYLDTNYLILGLVPGSDESRDLVTWAKQGESLVTGAICWYEFLCGPVSAAQTRAMRAFVLEILPFQEAQAVAAAKLFNATGRRRTLRVDCMIAGTALVAGARVATRNRADFEVFTPYGVVLA